MKKAILFLGLIWTLNIVISQESDEQILYQIRSFEKIVESQRSNVYDSILIFAEKQYELALQLNDSLEIGRAYLSLALAHNNLEESDHDLKFLMDAMNLFTAMDNEEYVARTKLEMASMYREARSDLFSPVQILQNLKDFYAQRAPNKYLGRIYLELGLHYRNNYKHTKETDSITFYYNAAKEVAKKAGVERIYYASINNIADYYLFGPQKNLDSVIILSESVIKNNSNDNRNLTVAHLNKAIAMQEKGNASYIDHLHEGFENSKKIRPLRIQKAAASLLYSHYLKLEDYQRALEYYKISIQREVNKRSYYQNMVFENLEKSNLINTQNKKLIEIDLKKQRNLTYLLMVGLVLLILFSVLYYRNYRTIKLKSKEIQKKKENIEWLLKEIHHRVKNNLQMIVGLLDLQQNSIKNEHASMVLNDASSRVKSIALIHQNLYSGDTDMVSVGFKKYVSELVNNLLFSYKMLDRIDLDLEIDELELPFDKAVIFGLLITELVTNTLKHAFPDQSKCNLSIQILKNDDETVTFQAHDNGIGLPKDFLSTNDTLGIDLIKSLVQDLNGDIRFGSGQGTKVNILFNSLKT